MKTFYCFVLIMFCSIFLSAQSADTLHIIPVLNYDFLNLKGQNIQTSGMGIILQKHNMTMVGIYKYHKLEKKPALEYSSELHGIQCYMEKSYHSGELLAVLKSDSDKPLVGGLHTFRFAGLYGWNLKKSQKWSVLLGSGIGFSDFGITYGDGKVWPLIPIPLIRARYQSGMVTSSFEFITGPVMNLELKPTNQLRLLNEVRMDQFRDIHDLLMENTLEYQPFVDHGQFGKLFTLSAGYRNGNLGAFNLQNDEHDYEIQYQAMFGSIDLTLLKFTYGWCWNSRELIGREEPVKQFLGKGIFCTLQAMYQF